MCIFLAEWVSTDHGKIPAYAYSGGSSEDGRTLYICKDYYHGEPCSGKIGYHTGSCKIPWGDRENNDYYYQVLTSPPWALYKLQWKGSYSKGSVPSGAVSVGSGVYVGRYKRGSGKIPGKVVKKHNTFFYGYNGKEIDERKNYEVLVATSRYISYYELTDVQYDLTKATETFSTDFQPVGAKKRVTNTSPFRVSSEISITIEQTEKVSWSEFESVETVSGRTMKVRAGVPFVKGKAEWGVTSTEYREYRHGEEHTETKTISHSITVRMPPNSEALVYMVAREAYLDVPFSGKLKIYFSDGGTYSARTDGVFQDVHMASYESRIEGENGRTGVQGMSVSEPKPVED